MFEALVDLGDPYSLTLHPSVKPIQAAPHRYATLKISDSGQLVGVNEHPLDVQYSNSWALSFSHKTEVRICLEPSQTINKAMISQWLLTSRIPSKPSN